MMTLISWVNRIYGSQELATLPSKCCRKLHEMSGKVIWKSRGILFCLTCWNPVLGINEIFTGLMPAVLPNQRTSEEGCQTFFMPALLSLYLFKIKHMKLKHWLISTLYK